MARPDLISVIIVNFNGGDLFADCVAAVLGSTAPVELFIVDNASTDNSLFRLRQLYADEQRLTIIQNTANLGFARANNMAIASASGEYLLFVNPDCVIKKDTLERMRNIMSDHPEAGMGGCLILNPDGSEQKGCRRRIPTPWLTFVRVMGLSRLLHNHPWFSDFYLSVQPLPKSPVPIDAISGSFMFVRRSAMEKVGVMDGRYFLHCEDLDWCMRFRENNYKVLFVPDIVVTHYKGTCGKTRPLRVMWHMHRGMVRFYRKFFRRRYSIALMWLVFVAVWGRFSALIVQNILRRSVLLWYRGDSDADERSIISRKEPNMDIRNIKERKPPAAVKRQGILLLGATSQIGHFLIPKLEAAGYRVYALTRRGPPMDGHENVTWVQADIQGEGPLPALPDVTTLIHLAPLWLLPDRIAEVAALGIDRVIAFSSMSRLTKIDSTSIEEKAVASNLARSEERCASLCRDHNVAWTIFRPTLIYGCGMDRNVTTITKFIKRFGFFPIVGAGKGMRQPVHAEDLANACVAVISCEITYGRVYSLSGGQKLSYKDMIEAIFRTLGKRPQIIKMPLPLLRTALKILSVFRAFRHITPAMADRMNHDLCVDYTDAMRDFGYQPRRFLGTSYQKQHGVVLEAPSDAQQSKEPQTGRSVLVTGANGFIGSALCEQLLTRGHQVVGVVRSLEAANTINQGVKARIIEGIEHQVDWHGLLDGIDCVVHLAAFVHETPIGPLNQARIRYQQLNVDATVRLAKAASNAGVKKFIYISTVKVQGERSHPGGRFDECMTPDPFGPYAESKLYAEYALRKIEYGKGLEVVVIRAPLVYGPEVKANFLRLLRFIERGVPLPFAKVHNNRSFVYLGNLTDVLVRCVDHPASAGQTFLVSDGEDISTPELVRALAYFLGRKPKLLPIPIGLLRLAANASGSAASINRLIDSLVIDNSKVRKTLNWEPPYTLLAGLECTVNWYRQKMYPLKVYTWSGKRPSMIHYERTLLSR